MDLSDLAFDYSIWGFGIILSQLGMIFLRNAILRDRIWGSWIGLWLYESNQDMTQLFLWLQNRRSELEWIWQLNFLSGFLGGPITAWNHFSKKHNNQRSWGSWVIRLWLDKRSTENWHNCFCFYHTEGVDLSDLATEHSICASKSVGGMLGWISLGRTVRFWMLSFSESWYEIMRRCFWWIEEDRNI